MKKRIVSFLMALVMAVSLLPVSAFAANGAYTVAEDTTAQRRDYADMIAVQAATEPEQVDGVYQIKTADELVWFQKQVTGGQTSINAALVADIDLSSVCSAELGKNWTPIPVYAGMFDGNGHVITNLYINGATVAKQALFAELSAAGTVKNLGIKNSSVTMTTAKKVNNARAALLVGYNNGGAILNCYVTDSYVTTNGVANGQCAAICGADEKGRIVNCYSIGNTITEKNNRGQVAGIVGHGKGTIENCYVVNTTLSSTNTAVKSICGSKVAPTYRNCYYLNTGKADDNATAKDDAWFKSDEAVNALGSRYFAKDTGNKNNGYPVLTFSDIVADKSALKAELDRIPTSGFYTENDRYNGVHVSQNGFWADMLAFVKNAQDLYDNESAAQSQVDEAAATLKSGLQAFLDNLIPAGRANTTLLYEELQKSFTAEDYSAKSWAAYQTVRDKAEALMATMFDAEGNPTDDNKAAAQESIETLAAELETARKALDKNESSDGKDAAQYEIKEIQCYYDRYANADLSGYTAESIETLRAALTQAKKLADELVVDTMGSKDGIQLGQALRALRKAIYALETIS